MAVDQKIRDRIRDLIQDGERLKRGRGGEFDQIIDSVHEAECGAWIAAAEHVISLVCPSPTHPYRKAAERAIGGWHGYMVHRAVGNFAAILGQLAGDIERGLLSSIENEVRAETFDDLLDHATAYLSEGRKDPAATIAGVVFEDTIRRLCRKNEIEVTGKTCEPLINALTVGGILTKLEAKEAKAASDLRNAATHAAWDEFGPEQVDTLISFAKRLIRDKIVG